MLFFPKHYSTEPLWRPISSRTSLGSWLVAGVGKGFAVVPLLQKRGLLRTEYTGSALRKHLGLPYQHGLAKRVF